MNSTETTAPIRKLVLNKVTLRDLQGLSEAELQLVVGGRRPGARATVVMPTSNVGGDCGGTVLPGVGADQLVFPTTAPDSLPGSHCGGTLFPGTRKWKTR